MTGQWQAGYGVFSFAKNQRNIIIKYIISQEEHHRNKPFKKEHIKMLTDFDAACGDK